MSPILGIIASSIQPGLNATSFESIATVTVGSGGQANVEFTSIPSTYKHLQVRYIARTVRGEAADDLHLQFNSDTGSNYSYHYLQGTGSAATAGAGSSTTVMLIPTAPGNTATSNTFGAGVVDILDYANTNKYKTMRALGGDDRNGAGEILLESGSWRNTNAITTLTFKAASASNFAQYSTFALYGIKGA